MSNSSRPARAQQQVSTVSVGIQESGVAAARMAAAPSGPRSRGEAAATSSLEPVRKSCGQHGQAVEDDKATPQVAYYVRSTDCKDATCSKCAGVRSIPLAKEVEAAVKAKFAGVVTFLTFTADGTAFGGREAEFLMHVRSKHAIGETLRMLRDRGWIGRHAFVVMEFQGNGMLHYHAIVDGINGEIPQEEIYRAWNREQHRPAWAGPAGVFEGKGKLQGQPRPLVGFTDVEPPECRDAAGKAVSPVVAYVCKYVSGGGKNPTPQWFDDFRDGRIDGKRHNAQLHSSSRGFFEGIRKKPGRAMFKAKRPPYRRRDVRERHLHCRVRGSLLRRTCVEIEGVQTRRYELLGNLAGRWDYGRLADAMFPPPVAHAVKQKPGYWLTHEQAEWAMTTPNVARSIMLTAVGQEVIDTAFRYYPAEPGDEDYSPALRAYVNEGNNQSDVMAWQRFYAQWRGVEVVEFDLGERPRDG